MGKIVRSASGVLCGNKLHPAQAERLRTDGFLAASITVIAAISKNLSPHDLQRVCLSCLTNRPPESSQSSTTSTSPLRPQMGHGREANRTRTSTASCSPIRLATRHAPRTEPEHPSLKGLAALAYTERPPRGIRRMAARLPTPSIRSGCTTIGEPGQRSDLVFVQSAKAKIEGRRETQN